MYVLCPDDNIETIVYFCELKIPRICNAFSYCKRELTLRQHGVKSRDSLRKTWRKICSFWNLLRKMSIKEKCPFMAMSFWTVKISERSYWREGLLNWQQMLRIFLVNRLMKKPTNITRLQLRKAEGYSASRLRSHSKRNRKTSSRKSMKNHNENRPLNWTNGSNTKCGLRNSDV